MVAGQLKPLTSMVKGPLILFPPPTFPPPTYEDPITTRISLVNSTDSVWDIGSVAITIREFNLDLSKYYDHSCLTVQHLFESTTFTESAVKEYEPLSVNWVQEAIWRIEEAARTGANVDEIEAGSSSVSGLLRAHDFLCLKTPIEWGGLDIDLIKRECINMARKLEKYDLWRINATIIFCSSFSTPTEKKSIIKVRKLLIEEANQQVEVVPCCFCKTG